jgi:hypothetical protein
MGNYTPKTRLEKILTGAAITPRNGLEKAVAAAMASIASALELPVVSAEDNGDLLGVDGGKWKKVAPPAPPQLVFETTGTMGEDTDHKETITLNKTAEELYDAIAGGKTVVIAGTVMTGGGATVDVVFVSSASCSKMTVDATSVYSFRFVGADGTASSVDNLAGTDTVVLTGEAAS